MSIEPAVGGNTEARLGWHPAEPGDDVALLRGELDACRAEIERLRALADTARLLGPARMVLDRCAVLLGEGEDGAEAAAMAQRIVDLIGHPVTDEPPHALVELERLRAQASPWCGPYILGRWADEVRHADPCDCDIDDESTGEACMDNSEWGNAVFAAGGAFSEPLVVKLPRTPPELTDDGESPFADVLLAESVPRSALVQVGWRDPVNGELHEYGHGEVHEVDDGGRAYWHEGHHRCEAVYVLREPT